MPDENIEVSGPEDEVVQAVAVLEPPLTVQVTGAPSTGTVVVKSVDEATVAITTDIATVAVRAVDHVELVNVSPVMGPEGPEGPQGPPGDGVPDLGTANEGDVIYYNGTHPVWSAPSYRHVQSAPAATWVIDHPIPYPPSVTVVDSAGNWVMGSVTYEPTRITITFLGAFSGEAYLS